MPKCEKKTQFQLDKKINNIFILCFIFLKFSLARMCAIVNINSGVKNYTNASTR
jgi:hypothetical protein